MTDEPLHPNKVDVYVGARLRMRRKLRGVSQDQLAKRLGITFQQVQKYERGSNRISASKLYAAAQVLQVPVAFFFDGLPDPLTQDTAANTDAQQAMAMLSTSEGLELMQYFPQIAVDDNRRRVLDLIHALADDDTDAA